MRKPDAEVFKFILESEHLQKEALLFIDDSEQHVIGARSLGIQAMLLEKGDDVISLLTRSGILT
jgi:putative hydrolase of the HAD superfamily